MVSAIVCVSGSAARIWRVASMPSSRGMLMSSTATVGRSCLARATASAPSDASPMTSMSGSPARMRLTPSRTIAWSSASSTLILPPPASPFIPPGPSRGLSAAGHDRGKLGHDLGPALGPRDDPHRPAEGGGALHHAAEAHADTAAPLRGRGPGREPPPVVPNPHQQAVAGAGHVHVHPGGAGVLDGVPQLLLGDPEHRGLERRVEAPAAEPFAQGDLEPAGFFLVMRRPP